MDDSDVERRLTEYFGKIRDLFVSELLPSSVVFYAVQNDKILHERSGVLFAVGDAHFVLTASHDLTAIIRHGIPLFVSPSGDGIDPVPLHDAQFTCTDEKLPDVAVCRLTPRAVSELLPRAKFLRLNDVDLAASGNDAMYAVVGHPAELFRLTEDGFGSDPFTLFGRPYHGPYPEGATFDPQVHLSLGFEPQGINALTGSSVSAPHIRGMSGCGIWRIGQWPPQFDSLLDTSKWRLVAIQHRWHKTLNYVQGTFVRHALSLIYHNNPDLQACMKMHYPPRR